MSNLLKFKAFQGKSNIIPIFEFCSLSTQCLKHGLEVYDNKFQLSAVAVKSTFMEDLAHTV